MTTYAVNVILVKVEGDDDFEIIEEDNVKENLNEEEARALMEKLTKDYEVRVFKK